MTELAFFQAMQRAMNDRAVEVGKMVSYSRIPGHRLRLGEVTVTEMNLYLLRNFWTKGVYIDTNEPVEETTGADWEWLIGHGNKWVQIRVQAKIVNRQGDFAGLGHPNGTRQQMDRLIAPVGGTVTCRWMPLYVFYTSQPAVPLSPPFIGPPVLAHGCDSQHAQHVRDIYGYDPVNPLSPKPERKASAHLSGSISWSQIFDGLVTRLQTGESLSAIMDSLADQALPETVTDIDQFWDSSIMAGPCNGDLPKYLQAIIELNDDDFNEAHLARIEVQLPHSEADASQRDPIAREGEPAKRQNTTPVECSARPFHGGRFVPTATHTKDNARQSGC